MKNFYFILILFSILIISTCTKTEQITGTNNKSIEKSSEYFDLYTPTTNDDKDAKTPWDINIERIWDKLNDKQRHQLEDATACLLSYIGSFTVSDLLWSNNSKLIDTNTPYEFRDEYLSKSIKGTAYIYSYYLLSDYGINNHIVQKNYSKHVKFLNTSVKIAYELQHGTNDDKVLIDKQMSDELNELLKLYRSSDNSKDIEPVLNYLEKDLETYQNKPKYEIAADFKSN